MEPFVRESSKLSRAEADSGALRPIADACGMRILGPGLEADEPAPGPT
jgi:hypothetical protein